MKHLMPARKHIWMMMMSLAYTYHFACSDDTAAPKGESLVDAGLKSAPRNTKTSQILPLDAKIDDVELAKVGEACQENADCDHHLCIETESLGKICSQTCTTKVDCSLDFECIIDEIQGLDQVRFCAPKASPVMLCHACEISEDCGQDGDFCLQIGHKGYCGDSCNEDADCPDQSKCTDVSFDAQSDLIKVLSGENLLQRLKDQNKITFDENQKTIKQCVPISRECQSCQDDDLDGYGVGADCLGSDCNDHHPLVYQNAKEQCDSMDNNCNGVIDEGLDPSDAGDLNCVQVGVCQNSQIACRQGAWSCGYPNQYQEEEQQCDGFDNDCDGQTDEHVDLQSDINHCGRCSTVCAAQFSQVACHEGLCQIDVCEENHYDLNGVYADGCEYACVKTGQEVCDGTDNDCNGKIDDGFDLSTDLENCGGCGNRCVYVNADSVCELGHCNFISCRDGFFNANQALDDGCEYACHAQGAEVCNGVDDDCNGITDDGFDLETDVNHCGSCQMACHYANGQARCDEGTCEMFGCQPGFHNLNLRVNDGCEYACIPSNRSIEICDRLDNDCDGITDDGFDLQRDVRNCGQCSNQCNFAHASSFCQRGTCQMGVCQPGFYDLNEDPSDGCEYACQFRSDIDDPDPLYQDLNCDGIDGNRLTGIFVAVSGRANAVGSIDDPLNTIQAAIEKAKLRRSYQQIYVSMGSYRETVVLAENVDLYGGYHRAENWQRDVDENDTLIQGLPIAIKAINLQARSAVTGFSLFGNSGSWQETYGSSIVVYVKNSRNVVIEDNRIVSSMGLDGISGRNGITGGNGNQGNNGGFGCDGCGEDGIGGRGALSACGAGGGQGGLGGYNNAHARNGENGFGLNGGLGGQENGYGCWMAGSSGANGTMGANGLDGLSGIGYALLNRFVVTQSGRNGEAGDHGGGGGGGAGGSGSNQCMSCGAVSCTAACFCEPDRGGGGGGGGSGGCGGSGGEGGGGAGSSFGVMVVDGQIQLRYNSIFTANGGRGGAGGNGARGGVGGLMGVGGLGRDDSGNGGNGGVGGNGGRGGDGGGGSGGFSYCTVNIGGQIVQFQNQCVHGNAGLGGDSGGNRGSNGAVGVNLVAN